MIAADGTVIPKDGLLEIANCDENGNITFKTDIPVGAKLYVREIAAEEHYILSDEKYPVIFDYAGQDTALVEITANGGEAIRNELIYGSVKGFKIDRETEKSIAGAVFGLFRADETEFTADNAILTAESDEDGVFLFEKIPYGNWLIKELKPADGYLPNEEIYPVTVSEHEQIIGMTVINDRIPEIGTQAAVDGEKEICATEVFTLTDTVSYKHLIPGKEYLLVGTLMDKSTGKPLLLDGKEINAETVFIPETPNGTVTVTFTFDAKLIKENTSLVVFETLYRNGKELAVHADIDDENQTVKVKVPEIGTKATVNGKKEVTASGRVKIEDTVSYKNLTPGKEYTVTGVLMNKATGEPLLAGGKEIRSSFTFKPDKPDGEINITFVFDASGLKTATEIGVFIVRRIISPKYRISVRVLFPSDKFKTVVFAVLGCQYRISEGGKLPVFRNIRRLHLRCVFAQPDIFFYGEQLVLHFSDLAEVFLREVGVVVDDAVAVVLHPAQRHPVRGHRKPTVTVRFGFKAAAQPLG